MNKIGLILGLFLLTTCSQVSNFEIIKSNVEARQYISNIDSITNYLDETIEDTSTYQIDEKTLSLYKDKGGKVNKLLEYLSNNDTCITSFNEIYFYKDLIVKTVPKNKIDCLTISDLKTNLCYVYYIENHQLKLITRLNGSMVDTSSKMFTYSSERIPKYLIDIDSSINFIDGVTD